MAAYGFPDDPSLRTTSHLRCWWLHYLRGYRILEVRRHPRAGWFGRTTYEESYLLLPKN